MRVGYAKLGRALHLKPESYGQQGDPAAPQLISRLARMYQDVDWVIASKNDGGDLGLSNVENIWPDDMPKSSWIWNGKGKGLSPNEDVLKFEREVIEPTIGALDGIVLDLGQHGTSHFFIPQSKKTWAEFDLDPETAGTHPHAWARGYGAQIIRGMNIMGDRTDGDAPVVYLCEDSRNYHKARDVKWPTGTDDILAQHQWSRSQIHERFRDGRSPGELGWDVAKSERGGELWRVDHNYRHGGTEFMILEDFWDEWGEGDYEDRDGAGIATTAYWSDKPHERRSWWVLRVLLEAYPDAKVYGKWDKKCTQEADEAGVPLLENTVEDFPMVLGSFRATLCLPPASRTRNGAMWCCAKPWQAFAARTVAFHVGDGDRQGWIIPSRRPQSASQEVAPGLWSVRTDWTDEDLALAQWLRVETREELHARAVAIETSPETWQWLVAAQRRLLRRRWDEHLLERTIASKLGL